MSTSERDRTTRLSAAEITAFLDDVFPGSMEHFVIEEVRPMQARVRMLFNEFRLRPGGTISGQSLMILTDGLQGYAFWHDLRHAKSRRLLPD